MSNNPFVEDVDARERRVTVDYWFEFDNGTLANVESIDGAPWRLEIHRPEGDGDGSRDLEQWSGLDVAMVTRVLDELRAEPAGVEQPSTAYTVPDDA